MSVLQRGSFRLYCTYTVLDTVPPSMLKLSVEWPAIIVPAQYRSVQHIPFPHKVVLLYYDHNAVLDTAPSSVLKLPVDRPASKNIDAILMDGADNIEEQQPPVAEGSDDEAQQEDEERRMKLNF
jgi:hypothetical protein